MVGLHVPDVISSYPSQVVHCIHNLQSVVLVAHSCLTLCDSMDCSLPGFSVHGILQERILEQIAFSRGSSWHRDRTQVSCIVGRLFTIWATMEAPGRSQVNTPLKSQPFPLSGCLCLHILVSAGFPLRSRPCHLQRDFVKQQHYYSDRAYSPLHTPRAGKMTNFLHCPSLKGWDMWWHGLTFFAFLHQSGSQKWHLSLE